MLKGKVFDPISLIKSKDSLVRDLKITIKNNWLSVDVDIKLLAADIKVKAEGSIFLNRETKTVVIDLKKIELPLSKSKKILMYILKKNLSNETIIFDDEKIYIKL